MTAAGARSGLLIVWWSMTGASCQLAHAAALRANEALREGGHEATAADRCGPADEGIGDAGEMVRDGGGGGGEIEVEVRLLRADQADAGDVLHASAYLFVMPEMLGSMAGRMKDFFDRTYYGVLDRVNGRPYALIVAAGSDGQGAVRQAERIATGWRLRRVLEPLNVCVNAQTPERILAPKVVDADALARAGEVGATLALGLQMKLW